MFQRASPCPGTAAPLPQSVGRSDDAPACAIAAVFVLRCPAPRLRAAAQSLWAQSHRPAELILIDCYGMPAAERRSLADGCAAAGVAWRYCRAHVDAPEAALEFAARMATGDLLLLAEADYDLEPHALRRAARRLSDSRADAASFRVRHAGRPRLPARLLHAVERIGACTPAAWGPSGGPPVLLRHGDAVERGATPVGPLNDSAPASHGRGASLILPVAATAIRRAVSIEADPFGDQRRAAAAAVRDVEWVRVRSGVQRIQLPELMLLAWSIGLSALALLVLAGLGDARLNGRRLAGLACGVAAGCAFHFARLARYVGRGAAARDCM